MSVLEALAIVGVGLGAGTINTIVGSGSLITFPTLLAFGFPAIVANVSNNVGLVPGSLSGVVAYRRELQGQGMRIRTLAVASAAGSAGGAAVLLVLPGNVFRHVVPILILGACVLVALQPGLARRVCPSISTTPRWSVAVLIGIRGRAIRGVFRCRPKRHLDGVARDLHRG